MRQFLIETISYSELQTNKSREMQIKVKENKIKLHSIKIRVIRTQETRVTSIQETKVIYTQETRVTR
jgi:hypothetical protein